MIEEEGDSRWTVIFLILFLSLSVSLFFHHTVLLRLSLYLSLSHSLSLSVPLFLSLSVSLSLPLTIIHFSFLHLHSLSLSLSNPSHSFLESPIGRFDSFVPFTDYSSEQGPRTERSFLQIELAQSHESSCYCPYLPHCHFLPRYVRAEFVSLHVSVLFPPYFFIFL